jgi:hypothetical protein
LEKKIISFLEKNADLYFFINYKKALIYLVKQALFNGGENGIRTHERIASLHAFQACAFNHSATSP